MSTTNPPEPKNPRHGRAAPELHTALLALSICLLVPTDAHLQTETGPPEQADRPTSTDTGGSGANPDNDDPRIYAQEPCMSNAPGSPKAFEGTVMRTTQNGVHFRVDFHDANSRQKMGYFLFELRGLAGREKIRIDFVNVGRWGNSRSIVPMYSQGVEQMSSPELLWSNIPSDGQYEYVRTQTGQKIPRTHGLQNWHYFKEVKIEKGYDEKQLTVRHVIPSNTRHMYVAHRIPYTFSYHKYYMNKLREKAKYGSDHLTVHLVGKSKGGVLFT